MGYSGALPAFARGVTDPSSFLRNMTTALNENMSAIEPHMKCSVSASVFPLSTETEASCSALTSACDRVLSVTSRIVQATNEVPPDESFIGVVFALRYTVLPSARFIVSSWCTDALPATVLRNISANLAVASSSCSLSACPALSVSVVPNSRSAAAFMFST